MGCQGKLDWGVEGHCVLCSTPLAQWWEMVKAPRAWLRWSGSRGWEVVLFRLAPCTLGTPGVFSRSPVYTAGPSLCGSSKVINTCNIPILVIPSISIQHTQIKIYGRRMEFPSYPLRGPYCFLSSIWLSQKPCRKQSTVVRIRWNNISNIQTYSERKSGIVRTQLHKQ